MRQTTRSILDAAKAVEKHNIGIKCATILLMKIGSKSLALRKCGVVRTEPSAITLEEPFFVHRLSVKMSRDLSKDGVNLLWLDVTHMLTSTGRRFHRSAGTLKMTFTPKNGGEPLEWLINEFEGSGIGLGMYNTDESIRDFARSCMSYSLSLGYPLFLSTKNTILKTYDGTFRDIFQQILDEEFSCKFEKAGLTYEHRLIDDMVAQVLKWEGGIVWAAKLRRRRAAGHRCSVLDHLD